MSAGSLSGEVIVTFFAASSCLAPAITRPTVPFGVRVPPERATAPVIRQQRRAYYGRTAVIGACCIALVFLLQDRGSWWLSRIILLAEIVADLGCFLIARNRIAEVKQAERWYAGHRQVVATDTSWRTDPPRFPVRWVIPALTVIAVTVLTGALRYPDLPARVTAGGHLVPKSVVSVFAIVAAQLYVTVLWTGLMLIVYRSRPDIEAADAAGSTRRYRRFLAACTRAVLTLLALVDVTLLLVALRNWQVYRLSGFGSALPVLPFAVGLLILAVVAFRVGQGGSRLPGGGRGGYAPAAGVDRDDDRFWKAGLIYVNRDDPAILIGARFGVGWTFNLANPMAWLIIAGIVAAPVGLVLITTLARLAEAELPGRGQVEAGRNGLDGLVEALQERGAAALPAAMDPVTAGDGESRDGQFHHQVQPQVFGVQQKLAGQAVDHLALDPVPVVLDVFEQVGRCDYEQAGIDETPVPAGIKARDGRSQRVVQFAQDGPG
jgi:uncharacterized membrane protein